MINMKTIRNWKRAFLRSPILKTITFFLSVILSGVLTNSYISEITKNGKTIWAISFSSLSFRLILVYLVVIFYYNKMLMRYENDLYNFADQEFCKAYLTKELLPQWVKLQKDKIRKGDLSGLDELPEILKGKY